MATSPYHVNQYTPQHMTEEEQIQEAIRLSLGGSGASDLHPGVLLPCELEAFADYSTAGSRLNRSSFILDLAQGSPSQDDLPDPDVIQSAINGAKKASFGPHVSDLESVSQMLNSDFGIDFEEEIDCDGNVATSEEEVEETIEIENEADAKGIRKEGCCLQFGGRNVHYTKAYAQEIDISKIVSGPPESELYGNHLSRYYQPVNKTLHNVEHKKEVTCKDMKYWQLLLLIPSPSSALMFSPCDRISRNEKSENSLLFAGTPRRCLMIPPSAGIYCKEADTISTDEVNLGGSEPSAETRLGTKRDGSADTEAQARPKRLCVFTSSLDLSSVKRRYSSFTEGLQVNQEPVTSHLAEPTDKEHINGNGENSQPSSKKMRLIDMNADSITVKCNTMIGKPPRCIDLTQDANDDAVVECKNLHSRFTTNNLDISLEVLKNKEMQLRKRVDSTDKNLEGSSLPEEYSRNNNIENSSSNVASYHCPRTITNCNQTSVKDAAGSTIYMEKNLDEKQCLEDLIICANLTPAVREKSIQKGCDEMAGASTKLSASKPLLSVSRAALEALTNKKIAVGTQIVKANRRCITSEGLRRPPCKTTRWNKKLQSVKFRTQLQVLSVHSSAMTFYSPYHLKIFNEMDLNVEDDSCVPSLVDDYQKSKPGDPRDKLTSPAVSKTELLIGSCEGSSVAKIDAQSSIVEKLVEGAEMEEEMRAGPSGFHPCEMDENGSAPDDKLAVFNTSHFLKSYFDIVLKWWVINVSKNLIFPHCLAHRPACPPLQPFIIYLNFMKFTNAWRVFASYPDEITDKIKKAEKFLDNTNQQLEPSTKSLIMKDIDDLKTSRVIKDMLKYINEQYGVSVSMEYESHEVRSKTLRLRRSSSSFAERLIKPSPIEDGYVPVLHCSNSSTSANCSEEIQLVKIEFNLSGERCHSPMHAAIFTRGDLKRPPLHKERSCYSNVDANRKGQLTSSEMSLGLEQLSITTERPGSPDSTFQSQGSDDGYNDSTFSDESNRGSSEDSSHLEHKQLTPLLSQLQLKEKSPQSMKFGKGAYCASDREMVDTTKDEPLMNEKILVPNTPSDETHNNESNNSRNTVLKYSRFLSETTSHSSKDPNTYSVCDENGGIENEQSLNPLGIVEDATSVNKNITKAFHINDCGYTSDNNIENKFIHRPKPNSLSPQKTSSGGESSSDEESTTSHSSDEATRRTSLAYHSPSSDCSFDEINADEEELVSVWSSYVGKSSLYKNSTEVAVFSGPFKLLKYFEISCFGLPLIMHSITPDVYLTVQDQEKRYTISRADPFVVKITKPDSLSMFEMAQMAAKLGCFHGLGLVFQRLNGRGFMVQFRHTMRTGLFPEVDFVKAATDGLTNFIERHYNDESKKQFLDYLRRQFGVQISARLNHLLTPDGDEDMKFWTLTVGDVTPRNIAVHKTKQICDTMVLRWNKSRIGNCFLDLVSLLVTLPDPRSKEVQLLTTLVSYIGALSETLQAFRMGHLLHYHVIIMSIRKAAMLLVYQFMSEEDTYRGPTEQEKLYGMVWNAALFALDPDQVNWDCPWKEQGPCP